MPLVINTVGAYTHIHTQVHTLATNVMNKSNIKKLGVYWLQAGYRYVLLSVTAYIRSC